MNPTVLLSSPHLCTSVEDASRKEEALAEALDALNDPHPLVRLAGSMGGVEPNQQSMILRRILFCQPKLVISYEPTTTVDRSEIRLYNQLRLVVFPIILQSLIHRRWFSRQISEPSTNLPPFLS